jgi:hypothetical protein
MEELAAFMDSMVSVEDNSPKYQCQQSVNDFQCCGLYNPRAVLQQLLIIKGLDAQCMGNLVSVDIATPENVY